jgi:hypothetical protein
MKPLVLATFPMALASPALATVPPRWPSQSAALDLQVSAGISDGHLTVAGRVNLPDGFRLVIGSVIANSPGPQEQTDEKGTETSTIVTVYNGAFRTPPALCTNTFINPLGPFTRPCIPGSYSIEVAGPPALFQTETDVPTALIGGREFTGDCLVYLPRQQTYGLDCTRTVTVGGAP